MTITPEELRNHFVNAALVLIDPAKRKNLTFSNFNILSGSFKNTFKENNLPYNKHKSLPVYFKQNRFCLDIQISQDKTILFKDNYVFDLNVIPQDIKRKITPLLISFYDSIALGGLDLKNKNAFNNFISMVNKEKEQKTSVNPTIQSGNGKTFKITTEIKDTVANESEKETVSFVKDKKPEESSLPIQENKAFFDKDKNGVLNENELSQAKDTEKREEQKCLSKKEKQKMLLKLEKTMQKLQKKQEKVEQLYAKAKKIKDKL